MANIYVKLGSKIKGESTDDAHADWCEANSISVSCTQPVSQQSGTGGRSASGVQFEDFEFEKYIDTATPDIMFFCCAGEHIDKIEVECTQAAGDKNAYLRYEFENCMISEISRSGDGEPPQKLLGRWRLAVRCRVARSESFPFPRTRGGWLGSARPRHRACRSCP